MMSRIVYYRPEKGWANQDVSKSQPEKYYPTQKEAYDNAKDQLARNGGGEIIVTRKDNGQIRDKNTISPGNDPRNSKG
jgi:hypothetical protein